MITLKLKHAPNFESELLQLKATIYSLRFYSMGHNEYTVVVATYDNIHILFWFYCIDWVIIYKKVVRDIVSQ